MPISLWESGSAAVRRTLTAAPAASSDRVGRTGERPSNPESCASGRSAGRDQELTSPMQGRNHEPDQNAGQAERVRVVDGPAVARLPGRCIDHSRAEEHNR